MTRRSPKAEGSFVVVFARESAASGRAKMELFNIITRLAFGATMTLTVVILFCEQLLDFVP